MCIEDVEMFVAMGTCYRLSLIAPDSWHSVFNLRHKMERFLYLYLFRHSSVYAETWRSDLK